MAVFAHRQAPPSCLDEPGTSWLACARVMRVYGRGVRVVWVACMSKSKEDHGKRTRQSRHLASCSPNRISHAQETAGLDTCNCCFGARVSILAVIDALLWLGLHLLILFPNPNPPSLQSKTSPPLPPLPSPLPSLPSPLVKSSFTRTTSPRLCPLSPCPRPLPRLGHCLCPPASASALRLVNPASLLRLVNPLPVPHHASPRARASSFFP